MRCQPLRNTHNLHLKGSISAFTLERPIINSLSIWFSTKKNVLLVKKFCRMKVIQNCWITFISKDKSQDKCSFGNQFTLSWANCTTYCFGILIYLLIYDPKPILGLGKIKNRLQGQLVRNGWINQISRTKLFV